jgi:DNA-binding NarL/FixJ family response regulator
MTVRVAIVEDEPLYRGLLEQHLAQHPHFEVVGTFADGAAAVDGIAAAAADVVTLDIELPGAVDGIQTALTLRARDARLGIVILSNHADPRFLGALPREVTSGWSYLLKKSVSNVETLERAIAGAANGTVTLDPSIVAGMRPKPGRPTGHLTPRQLEILGLVAEGLSNAAIGDRLVLAEKSVENQLTAIYGELGIDRRATAEVHPRVRAVLAYLQDSRLASGSRRARR